MRLIKGKITSPFGIRRDPTLKDCWKHHNGIDIGASVGTTIYAPTDVVVIDIYEHYSGGLTLILADKKMTFRIGMCHLSAVKVFLGQSVGAGEVVANSGNTGHSTGPHLHLSLQEDGFWSERRYQNGTFKDPSRLLEFQP